MSESTKRPCWYVQFAVGSIDRSICDGEQLYHSAVLSTIEYLLANSNNPLRLSNSGSFNAGYAVSYSSGYEYGTGIPHDRRQMRKTFESEEGPLIELRPGSGLMVSHKGTIFSAITMANDVNSEVVKVYLSYCRDVENDVDWVNICIYRILDREIVFEINPEDAVDTILNNCPPEEVGKLVMEISQYISTDMSDLTA